MIYYSTNNYDVTLPQELMPEGTQPAVVAGSFTDLSFLPKVVVLIATSFNHNKGDDRNGTSVQNHFGPILNVASSKEVSA